MHPIINTNRIDNKQFRLIQMTPILERKEGLLAFRRLCCVLGTFPRPLDRSFWPVGAETTAAATEERDAGGKVCDLRQAIPEIVFLPDMVRQSHFV